MAKPIQLDFPARDRESEARQRLAEAPTEHAAAILELLELLEELHRRNVLSTLRGVVGAGEHLSEYLAEAIAQPESVRALRNAIALTKILSNIDPELLESVARALPPPAAGNKNQPPGLLRLLRLFWSPPVRHSLLALGVVLAAVGAHLGESGKKA